MTDAELAAAIREVSLIHGDFELSAGGRSDVYFDKFRFATVPQLLRPVAQRLAARVPPGVDRVAAPELGAVPLGTAVSLETGIPLVIVRKQAKAYGSKRQFEGLLEAGERVTVIEDVISTGSEAIRTASLLRDAGANVTGIVAVLDRLEGGRDNVQDAGFQLESVFTRDDVGA